MGKLTLPRRTCDLRQSFIWRSPSNPVFDSLSQVYFLLAANAGWNVNELQESAKLDILTFFSHGKLHGFHYVVTYTRRRYLRNLYLNRVVIAVKRISEGIGVQIHVAYFHSRFFAFKKLLILFIFRIYILTD